MPLQNQPGVEGTNSAVNKAEKYQRHLSGAYGNKRGLHRSSSKDGSEEKRQNDKTYTVETMPSQNRFEFEDTPSAENKAEKYELHLSGAYGNEAHRSSNKNGSEKSAKWTQELMWAQCLFKISLELKTQSVLRINVLKYLKSAKKIDNNLF
ncbi:uncharacterized protein LOC117173700 [Belonocnema kinseyi]|uniref:uncharacterized protein LOC117173700 n=1 Tax=Belonocnema kinseyi TaxID=2817044 RepID=UPI00143D9DAC|nr:uncharacterized protein LOC117173700 [Belonocnema kinseyi]